MKYIAKSYKNFRRIFTSMLSLVLIASALFLIFSVIKSNESTKNSIILLEQSTAEKATADFTSVLENAGMINSTLYTFVASNYPNLSEVESENHYMLNANIKNQIQLCTAMYDYISGVKVVTPAFDVQSGRFSSYNSEQEIYLGDKGSCSVYYTISEQQPFFLIKSKNQEEIGITIALNAYGLGQEIFYEYTPGQIKFVCDENGTILSCVRMEYLGKNINDFYSVKFSNSGVESQYITKQKTFYTCNKTNSYNLYILLFSDNKTYENFSPIFSSDTIVFFLVSFLILTILGVFISIFVYKPIQNLIKITSKYFPIPLIKNLDELEYLQQSIIKQSDKNEELSADMKKTVSALRQQEILALQSQISPHYISNMLDAINWIAIKKLNGPNEISYCAEKTAYLFRYGMNLSSSFDTLKNEIDIAKSTLDILNIRYRTNVELVCDVPDDMMELKIIKVLLQPFIENSVVHGFANYKEDGFITICAKKDSDIISLSISDNGKGMEEVEKASLSKKISDFSNIRESHIGLWNVNYRLHLLFGDDYTIDFKSEKLKGTTFTIEIPKIIF